MPCRQIARSESCISVRAATVYFLFVARTGAIWVVRWFKVRTYIDCSVATETNIWVGKKREKKIPPIGHISTIDHSGEIWFEFQRNQTIPVRINFKWPQTCNSKPIIGQYSKWTPIFGNRPGDRHLDSRQYRRTIYHYSHKIRHHRI